MTSDLQTYVDDIAAGLAAGAALEAWRVAHGYATVAVHNGDAPHEQGRQNTNEAIVAVLPGRFGGGQAVDMIEREVLVECRLMADAPGDGELVSETGTTIIYRQYRAHRRLVALMKAVLEDVTTALSGRAAEWTVYEAPTDFDNADYPLVRAIVSLTFREQTTMPNP